MSQPEKSPALDQKISASLLRLRMRSPFFATLALFARFRPSHALPTAATDGRDVIYNPEFMEPLPPKQFDAVLLHEVLHAALLHPSRRGARDARVWNLAADVVVNGIIAKQEYLELVPGSIREKELEEKTVEEIYELLQSRKDLHLKSPCLIPGHGHGKPGEGKPGGGKPGDGEGSVDEALRRLAEAEAHWKQALRQAEVVQRALGQGTMPAGWERIAQGVLAPQLDWRSQLWRFLVKTPTDFSDFDRRLIGRGLYLEALDGESVRVFVCIDTSGSVSEEQLSSFMGEVHGILRAYPHLEAELFYADAALYGPYPLKPGDPVEKPKGGGGTAFEPFFAFLEKERLQSENAVAIYLTDGHGSFPPKAPEMPTLWVVTPGGLGSEHFPFGEVARLLRDS